MTDSNIAIALLKDIAVGPDGSHPQRFTALGNGKVIFAAGADTNSDTGFELWITDGTSAGTTLLKDINPGGNGSNPQGFTAIGSGKFVFMAEDNNHGYEPWITDGTPTGTTLLKDINPGGSGSNAGNFVALDNGKVIFSARDASNGNELWITDGTTAGTTLVKNINPAGLDSSPHSFTAIGNGKAIFSAKSSGIDAELWITDGTAAGTTLLKDINPGGEGSFPSDMIAIGNGKFLFAAATENEGDELWITDGTPVGTTLFKDINPGQADSRPVFTATLGGGKFLFAAATENEGRELWMTDGTPAGTTLFKDLNPGQAGSFPQPAKAIGNGKFLFTAKNGNANTVWVTDGTAEGTKVLRGDISFNTDSFSIAALGDGRAFLSAGNGESGQELWMTDGTSEGTVLAADIVAGANGSFPTEIFAMGGSKFLFSAETEGNGRELYLATAGTGSADTAIASNFTLSSDQERLQVGPIGSAKSLQFNLDKVDISDVSELLIFTVDESGTQTPVGSFSLLKGTQFAPGFSQNFALDTQRLSDNTQLLFKLMGQNGSQTGKLSLKEDGTATLNFNGTAVAIGLSSSPAINLLSGDADSIDLSTYANQSVSINFSVYREAAFNNTVGLYSTDTATGGITDALSGQTLQPGDMGYKEAAIARQLGTRLTGQNGQLQTFTTGAIAGGSFLSMFLIADGNDINSSQIYFSHLGMNGGNDHVKLLGNNAFGFEDMAGLGDKDFNDIVVKFEVV
ncbi:MAG: ELWxxDGT repeat protein [Phormidesmis sp.]